MRKKVIFVLGMHRSGTSALSGVLARLGAGMPEHLIGPAADNPKGFYESQVVVDLNNSLLSKRGLTSADWREVPPPRGDDGESDDEELRIVDVLRQEFGSQKLICIKDPRLCKLAGLWIGTVAKFGYEPLAIIPLRNPYEVAESLRSRDGMTLVNSLLLWLRHVLDAEFYSRSCRRTFLRLDNLMQDWRGEMTRIGADLDVQWPRSEAEAASDVDDFLDRELLHHAIDDAHIAGVSALSKWVAGAWNALNTLLAGTDVEDNLKILDQLRARLNESADIFGKFSQEAQVGTLTLKAREQELHGVVDRQKAELAHYAEVLQAQSGQSETALSEAALERDRLRSTLEEAQAQVQAGGDELAALRREVSDHYEVELANLQSVLAGHERLIEELTGRETAAADTVEKLTGDLERMSDELQARVVSEHTLISEFEARLETQKSVFENALTQVEADNEKSLKAHLDDQQDAFQARLGDRQKEFDTVLAQAERDSEKLRNKLDRQKESFDAALAHAEETAKMERAAGFMLAERQMRVELNVSQEEIALLKERLLTIEQQKHAVDQEFAALSSRFAEQKTAFDAAVAHAQETAKLEYQAGIMVMERRSGRDVQAVRAQLEQRLQHLETVTSGLRSAYYGKTLRRRQYLTRLLPFWEKYDGMRTLKYIQQSGKFDAKWYLETYPDVAAAGVEPLTHYVLSGAREGRNPTEGFDGTAYLAANPHLFNSGANVFLVYLKQQAYLKDVVRKSGLFDAEWYLQAYPDVAAAGVDPLTHYFEFGAVEGRKPNTTFDTMAFIEQRPDIDAAYTNPLAAHILAI